MQKYDKDLVALKIWFTSDTHFNHNKDFIYKPRGFNSIDEMNQVIIKNWNSLVKPDDIVYHLGDIVLGDNNADGLYLFSQLNGQFHLIIGNHDTEKRIELYRTMNNVQDIQYATMIKYKKYSFYLSHYQTCMGNYDMQMSRTWCLHGHTHSKFEFDDNIAKNFNVALDAHNCYPIEIDEILKKIQDKWNKIHNEYEKQQSQLQKIKDIKMDEMLDF